MIGSGIYYIAKDRSGNTDDIKKLAVGVINPLPFGVTW